MCIALPTAMLISAGVAGAGAVGSAVVGSNAAKEAAKVQSKAAGKAADATMQRFEQVRADLKPYMTVGEDAIDPLRGLLGLDGGDAAGMLAALEQTPGYQFTLEQGLRGVQNSYAAKGLGSSGAALKGAAEYSTGLAQQTYQQQLANYFNLAGMGQNAAAQTGQFGTAATQSANNALLGGATATASGIVGSANAIGAGIAGATGAIGNSVNMLGLYNSGYLDTMLGQRATAIGNPLIDIG